jgi:hypothetical protein
MNTLYSMYLSKYQKVSIELAMRSIMQYIRSPNHTSFVDGDIKHSDRDYTVVSYRKLPKRAKTVRAGGHRAKSFA